MVLLIGVALELNVSSDLERGAFVVALVFSLIGDVFLMLPGERWFVFGLGSFLAGHLAYVVGLVDRRGHPGRVRRSASSSWRSPSS